MVVVNCYSIIAIFYVLAGFRFSIAWLQCVPEKKLRKVCWCYMISVSELFVNWLWLRHVICLSFVIVFCVCVVLGTLPQCAVVSSGNGDKKIWNTAVTLVTGLYCSTWEYCDNG